MAPCGRPWSVWFFTHVDGSFRGHYVNLELPHRRPVGAGSRTYTHDLVLDLWLDAEGALWVKDEDELDAALAAAVLSSDQVREVRAIAELARHELVAPRAWPLDAGWEAWRPPAALDQPLTFGRPHATANRRIVTDL